MIVVGLIIGNITEQLIASVMVCINYARRVVLLYICLSVEANPCPMKVEKQYEQNTNHALKLHRLPPDYLPL